MNSILLGWLLLANAYTFTLFGWDKWRATRTGASRASEIHLLTASALGGWIGGLLAMLLFRHKTAKTSFQVKFVAALVVLIGLLWTVHWLMHTTNGSVTRFQTTAFDHSLSLGSQKNGPDQVWCADITYISLPEGFAYLVAIMD